MKQKLIDVLKSFGYPVVLERSLAPNEYPDTFITFWNFDSSNLSYDNEDDITEYGYNVRLYSRDPNLVESTKKQILSALKKSGFIPDGCGNDFTFNSETLHLGWSVDVYILEENEDG